MAKKKTLLIVESPGKIKTIGQYAGDDFEVKASIGHIKDLPKKKVGVNTRSEFQTEFVVNDDKKDVVAGLKAAAKRADRVLIATDPDREGECIAQHIAEELNVSGKCRITFNEITKKAVQAAIQNPREINQSKVNAQSTRRILDRLVGYKLSPYLWRKVAPKTSAGRVQSAALLLIAEKEREIRKFVSRKYWTVHATLDVDGQKIEASVVDDSGKVIEYDSETEAKEIAAAIKNPTFEGKDVKKTSRTPYPPFTTSTLQQACASNFGLAASETMAAAQVLYEGMSIAKIGDVALITYMRTDSVRSAPESIDAAREYVKSRYEPEYLPSKARIYDKKTKNQQDAHEAIRPTYLEITPDQITMSQKYRQVYGLIRRRFIASQMEDAEIEQTKLFFKANGVRLEAKGSRIAFAGFTKMYALSIEEQNLPAVDNPKSVKIAECADKAHTTQPPKRYSEAQLIKTLEKEGIGRPSTYAAIIKNLVDREYVTRTNGSFFLSEMGLLVNDALQSGFSNIINLKFTSKMEENLDKIEEGGDHVDILKKFYEELKETIKIANKTKTRTKIETDLVCDKCSGKMMLLYGRNGKFLACEKYPECKFSKNLPGDVNLVENIEAYKTGIKVDLSAVPDDPCPECGAALRLRKGKFGDFYGCSEYPTCRFIRKVVEKAADCPACDGEIVKKKSTKSTFYSCNKYPECKTLYSNKPLEEKCDSCEWPLMNHAKKPVCINANCEKGVKIERKNFRKR